MPHLNEVDVHLGIYKHWVLVRVIRGAPPDTLEPIRGVQPNARNVHVLADPAGRRQARVRCWLDPHHTRVATCPHMT